MTAGSTIAKDSNGGAYIMRPASCGEWVQESKSEIDTAADKMYLQGVVTGINAVTPGKSDFFAGTDLESRYQYVLKYCQEHPLKNSWDGITELVREITGKTPSQLVPNR